MKETSHKPMLKHRMNFATICMLAILLLAVTLRFVLMELHWPIANSDESVIDLMARHIAYQGEHPIFFWGQNYMGTIQAYLGAILIHLFGSSAFSVRLGTLLLFSLYLVCMYFLVCLLYTPAYALFIVALLSIGSDRVMSIPLVANGGYAETMFFGAFIFLLATWLALTVPRQRARPAKSRLLAYTGLGLVIGLALWSDQLILTAIFTSGLFLWMCCRQEVRGWTIGALLTGVLVGSTPLIIYNVIAAPGQNSLYVLVGTVFSGAPRIIPFPEQLAHVLLISLPLATGMPFTSGVHAVCGTTEPYTHATAGLANLFSSSNPWLCIGTRGGWSLGLLTLWGLALAGVRLAIRRQRGAWQEAATDVDAQAAWRQRVRLYARLMLLGSGALWFALFALSAAAALTPRASSRYLICLLFAFPALCWPLWQGFTRVRTRVKRGQSYARYRFVLSALALGGITASYLVGVGDIFANLPASQRSYSQVNTLIQSLLARGATRVYSDYDTCNLLIFQSDEQIICSVLDERLQPGVDRYAPYRTQVRAAPHPAYLFPANSASARTLARQLDPDPHYQRISLEGYTIYCYSAAR